MHQTQDGHQLYAKTTCSAQLCMDTDTGLLLEHSLGMLVLVHLCLTD